MFFEIISSAYDDSVFLQNDFAHSSSLNNRVFIIADQNKKLKRGERLKIDFFAKSPEAVKIPLVSSIKFNNGQICPEDEPFNGEARCAKFEKSGNDTGGRWDGVLTVYPQSPRSGIRVDIELDQPAWALGVSFISFSSELLRNIIFRMIWAMQELLIK